MSGTKITRRTALARLGLGAAAAYTAPSVTRLSFARASSGASDASAPSPASPASTVSAPSPASAPSGPSLQSGPSAASGSAKTSGPPGADASVRSGECKVPGSNGPVRISRNDYQRAQQAIRRGDARPLREVLQKTGRQYPGRPVRVGVSSSGAKLAYHIQIVMTSGDIVSVTVDAGSGSVVDAWKC